MLGAGAFAALPAAPAHEQAGVATSAVDPENFSVPLTSEQALLDFMPLGAVFHQSLLADILGLSA